LIGDTFFKINVFQQGKILSPFKYVIALWSKFDQEENQQ
jgi:hypothetical protein